MAGERQSQTTLPVDPDRQETTLAEAYIPGIDGVLGFHLRLVSTHLAQGSPHRAFGELVKASRVGPMTPRLAAALVRLALLAGTEAAALTLIDEARETADGAFLIHLERQHLRLLRRVGQLERARKILEALELLNPRDRRARRAGQWLLQAEGRWEALDAALQEEVADAERNLEWRRAAGAMLRRARLLKVQQHEPLAAELIDQAAQLLEHGSLYDDALRIRIRQLDSLTTDAAPAHTLEDAARSLVRVATRAGKLDVADAELERLTLTREGRLRVEDTSGEGVHVLASTGEYVTPGQTERSLETAPGTSADDELATDVAVPVIDEPPSSRTPRANAARSDSGPSPRTNPQALRQAEAQFVARGAWKELADFYRERAAKARTPSEAAEILSRLAELLETELNDPAGAADAFGELVRKLGDRHALIEQVRLLRAAGNEGAVGAALNAAILDDAPAAQFAGLVLRAQLSLEKGEAAAAKSDFEASLKHQSDDPEALVGLLEAAAKLGTPVDEASAHRVLRALPSSNPMRLPWIRRFARAVTDTALAEWAWAEVALAAPDEEEAQDQLLAATRARGDDAALISLLQRLLSREPRGLRARPRRRELWAALERAGRPNEALQEIRLAARFEPGHREAWLALFDRLATLREDEEAAWALEHAATSTEDDVEREQLWRQLAVFCADALEAPERAAVYLGRADAMRRDREISAAEASLNAPLLAREGRQPARAAMASSLAEAPTTASGQSRALGASTPGSTGSRPALSHAPVSPSGSRPALSPRARTARADTSQFIDDTVPSLPPQPVPAPPGESEHRTEVEMPAVADAPMDLLGDAAFADVEDPLEVTSGDFVVAEEPPAPQPLGSDEPPPSTAGHFTGAQFASKTGNEQLFELVRSRPLESEGYRVLSKAFRTGGDFGRAELMEEIAESLDGRGPDAERAPKLMLSATDRAGLRHPTLREGAGELLTLVGAALCRLFPAKGRSAGTREEFRIDSGRGARQAADALLAAVRILGLRAPDVYLSEDNGPPFSTVWTQGPKLLVGRTAVDYPLPPAELRFFAGRALFTQTPDLMVLRALRKDQLYQALDVLGRALESERGGSPEVKLVRGALPARSLERIRTLYELASPELRYGVLADAARHSANRAGLAVCGSVAPALDALRAKKALAREMEELISFAASERHLQLRMRWGGPGR